MDIKEKIKNSIEYSNKEYRKLNKILDILKDKKEFIIEQYAYIIPSKEGNLFTKDNRQYTFESNAIFYSIKQEESTETGLKKIKSIEDIDVFIYIDMNYKITYYITKLTHIFDGEIKDNKSFNSQISTFDKAYEVTLEELQKIVKIMNLEDKHE